MKSAIHVVFLSSSLHSNATNSKINNSFFFKMSVESSDSTDDIAEKIETLNSKRNFRVGKIIY